MNDTANCTNRSGLESVDFLTDDERNDGGLVAHFLIAFYACFSIATVCDYYFIPATKIMSKRLALPSDVAGATLLATSAAAPGFFIAIIGCFLTKDDMGLGTILGSCVISTHLMTGVCALFAAKAVQLDWWPITRDYMFYILSLTLIIAIIHDQTINWYEALLLLILYTLYLVTLRFQKIIKKCGKKLYRFFNPKENKDENENSGQKPDTSHHCNNKTGENGVAANCISLQIIIGEPEKQNDMIDKEVALQVANMHDKSDLEGAPEHHHESIDLFTIPKNSIFNIVVWVIRWPIAFLFFVTIPDCTCKRWRKFYPLTFLLSLMYIGGFTYVLTWMLSVIGDTLHIPDAVMAVSLLAFAASIPDLYCSISVFRQGFGNMALATGLGCNLLDLLIDLGLPWIIQASFLSETHVVETESNSFGYSGIYVLISGILIYLAIAINRFRIDRKLSFIALLFYGGFIAVAIILEMNIFQLSTIHVTLATCEE